MHTTCLRFVLSYPFGVREGIRNLGEVEFTTRVNLQKEATKERKSLPFGFRLAISVASFLAYRHPFCSTLTFFFFFLIILFIHVLVSNTVTK